MHCGEKKKPCISHLHLSHSNLANKLTSVLSRIHHFSAQKDVAWSLITEQTCYLINNCAVVIHPSHTSAHA